MSVVGGLDGWCKDVPSALQKGRIVSDLTRLLPSVVGVDEWSTAVLDKSATLD